MSQLAEQIGSWFLEHRRDLPWRASPKDPYLVWISEVMLQQTRVEVVIPYFERFIRQFPNLASLAEAEDEILLKAWEGLGYYSRVRALKKTAILLISSNRTTLPDDLEQLLQLPGIGPYTAGAILAFAFQKRGFAIDGNVKRVISRLFSLTSPIDSKELWNQVKTHLEEQLLIREDSSVIMEGLIELGALVCTPTPKCALCPVAAHCMAFKHDKQLQLPMPKKRAETSQLSTEIALIYHQHEGIDFFLIKPPKEEGLFKGLALFPTEMEVFGEKGMYWLGKRMKEESFLFQESLGEVVQTYTRYKETLRPGLHKAIKKVCLDGLVWITKDQLETLSMPAGHRKLRNRIFAFLERS